MLGIKSGLMSFLMAKLVEKNMWDFRGFRVKRKGLIWGCKEEGNKRIFWCSGVHHNLLNKTPIKNFFNPWKRLTRASKPHSTSSNNVAWTL